MIKTLMGSIRDYMKVTVATPLLVLGEVLCEMLIPFITANLIDAIKDGATVAEMLPTAGFLVLIALTSLAFGAAAGGIAEARYDAPIRLSAEHFHHRQAARIGPAVPDGRLHDVHLSALLHHSCVHRGRLPRQELHPEFPLAQRRIIHRDVHHSDAGAALTVQAGVGVSPPNRLWRFISGRPKLI